MPVFVALQMQPTHEEGSWPSLLRPVVVGDDFFRLVAELLDISLEEARKRMCDANDFRGALFSVTEGTFSLLEPEDEEEDEEEDEDPGALVYYDD